MNDTSHHKQYVITILSRDRVGIIADVSGAISALEGDIADLRESVLRGYLTMILLVTFPVSQTAEAIRHSLQAINTQRADMPPLDVIVRPADDALPAGQSSIPDDAYILTATGSDRIGFVASVSGFCARHNINILDLSTAVSEGAYTMILLVDLSQRSDIADIRRQLQAFGQESGLSLVLQHYAIFKTTNEIGMI
ncbi:MAG: ACT domain-containing protein [Anaerolineae bacterium]|nr:ACT domain-containing protein [Anaerolineae bacterium]